MASSSDWLAAISSWNSAAVFSDPRTGLRWPVGAPCGDGEQRVFVSLRENQLEMALAVFVWVQQVVVAQLLGRKRLQQLTNALGFEVLCQRSNEQRAGREPLLPSMTSASWLVTDDKPRST